MALTQQWKKLDDDLAQDDRPASSLLGMSLQRNAVQLATDILPGCGHTYVSGANGQPLEVSSPADEWFGLPMLAPRCRGLTEIGIQMLYEVVDASVDVALWADGQLGEETTLTTTGAVTWSDVITVRVPDRGAPYVRVALGFKSHTAASVATVTFGSFESNGLLRGVTATLVTGSLSTGKTHYWCDTNSTTAGYCGNVTFSGGSDYRFQMYPGYAVGPSTVYPLGRLKIHGWRLNYVERSDFGTLPIPSSRPFGTRRPVRAGDVQALDRVQWELLSTRSQWLTAACSPTAAIGMHGAPGYRMATRNPGGALIKRRADSLGVRAVVAGATWGGPGVTPQFTVTIEDFGGTDTSSSTVNLPGGVIDIRDTADHVLWPVSGAVTVGATWGAEDSVPLRQLGLLGYAVVDVDWPTSTVGETLRVKIKNGTSPQASVHWSHAAMIVERFPEFTPR